MDTDYQLKFSCRMPAQGTIILRNTLVALFLLLSLALPFSSMLAQDTLKIDKDGGFYDILLGKGIDAQPGQWIKTGKRQEFKRYRPDEDLVKFEQIKLQSVRLNVFQGKVHSIEVKTPNEKETDRLLNYYWERYGPGVEDEIYKNKFSWKGTKTALLYEKDFVMDRGEFLFVDLKVHRDYEIYVYKKEYGDE